MHELTYTKNIYDAVMRHASEAGAASVERVALRIGVMHGFVGDFVRRYWSELARGSIAEHARIDITEVPAACRCSACGAEYPVAVDDASGWACPKCGAPGAIVTGMELELTAIEVRTGTSDGKAG